MFFGLGYNGNEAQAQPQAQTQQAPWSLSGMYSSLPQGGLGNVMNYGQVYGGVPQGKLPEVDPNSKAPSYDLNTPMGLNNPMLQATLRSGNAGAMETGIKAFLGTDYNPFISEEVRGYDIMNGVNPTETRETTQRVGDITPMLRLAQETGYDLSRFNQGGIDPAKLYSGLNNHLRDYAGIQGMSNGWTGSADPRNAARTLYRNVGGVLQPVSRPQQYSAPETSGYLRQNPLLAQGLAAAGTILTGGLAAGAAAGAGGAAAAGSSGSGLAGAAAGGLGYGSQFAALPAWAQGALNGAASGGLNSILSGQGNGMGVLTGALTGGFAPVSSSMIGSAGLPSYMSSGLNGALMGGLSSAVNGGDALRGILGGGLGGLGGGVGGQLGGRVGSQMGGMAGRTLAQLLYGR